MALHSTDKGESPFDQNVQDVRKAESSGGCFPNVHKLISGERAPGIFAKHRINNKKGEKMGNGETVIDLSV